MGGRTDLGLHGGVFAGEEVRIRVVCGGGGGGRGRGSGPEQGPIVVVDQSGADPVAEAGGQDFVKLWVG